MIVESKAIEPKASSATSVYSAVIINIQNVSDSIFVWLQIYCPDVMSGNISDALYAANNWIEVPKIPHNGAEPYDFKVGGIVLVSYQNGNINSPQFVRYVLVSDDIIEHNKLSIKYGIEVTSDVFDDLLDNRINLDTPGLKKGLALLPALVACNNNSYNKTFHTYLYKSKRNIIFRCGKYGMEFVLSQNNNKNHNFDYNQTKHSPLKIIQYLLQNENINNENQCLIDIVNSTVIDFETEDKYKKQIFSKINEADKLYWYTMLLGYVYGLVENNGTIKQTSYDTSSKISVDLNSYIQKHNIKMHKPDDNSKLAFVNRTIYFNSNLYSLGYLNLDNYNIPDKDNIFNFVDQIWNNINKNEYFNSKIASRYAMILTNNLITMKEQYSVTSYSNKTLIVLVTLASAFPVIEKLLVSFNMNKAKYNLNTESVNFLESVIKNINNETLDIEYYTLAEHLTKIYFDILELPYESNYYNNITKPYDYIYKSMRLGIRYIIDNYNKIKEVMNSDTIISDDLPVSTDTSEFSYKKPNGYWNTEWYCKFSSKTYDSKDVQNYMFSVCKKYNINPALMLSIMLNESGYIKAGKSYYQADVSPELQDLVSEDYGCCCINKIAHKELEAIFGKLDFLDPKDSILCGTYLLARNFKYFGGDKRDQDTAYKAAMAYNLGIGGAEKRLKSGTPTWPYADKVIKSYYNYYKGKDTL